MKCLPKNYDIPQNTGAVPATRRDFLAQAVSVMVGLAGVPIVRSAGPAKAIGRRRATFLDRERETVSEELRVFERLYLPVMQAPFYLGHDGGVPRLIYLTGRGHRSKFARESQYVRDAYASYARDKQERLVGWQAATRRLDMLLNALPDQAATTLDSEEFLHLYTVLTLGGESVTHDYLRSPDCPVFSLRRGRICWHAYPHGGWVPWPEYRAEQALRLLHETSALPLPGEPRTTVACHEWPQIEKWYAELDPLSGKHIMAYERLLPLLAEFNPALAIKVLDRKWMKDRVLQNPELTEKERVSRLRRLHYLGVTSYLSSTLAFVMETVANNHFRKIGRLLRYPEIYGLYNGMMPELVFAVLYRKVEMVRQLRSVFEGCRGQA
jgi:hypothetical protein